MGSAGPTTLLEAIEAVCNVDVDAVDPRVSTAMPFKPHNRTSQPLLVREYAGANTSSRNFEPGDLRQHNAITRVS